MDVGNIRFLHKIIKRARAVVAIFCMAAFTVMLPACDRKEKPPAKPTSEKAGAAEETGTAEKTGTAEETGTAGKTGTARKKRARRPAPRRRLRRSADAGRRSVFRPRTKRGVRSLPPEEEETESSAEQEPSETIPRPVASEKTETEAKKIPPPKKDGTGRPDKPEVEKPGKETKPAAPPKRLPPPPTTPPKREAEKKTRSADWVHTQLRDGFHTRLKTGRLLVVWLLDGSISMHDDYQKMKKKIDYFYNVEGLKSVDDMKMAVIVFSDRASLFLKPTSDVGKIKRAFDSVPAGSGDEMPMNAVIQAVKATSKSKRDILIVLMTDEKGQDSDRCEAVGRLLKSRDITLFAVTPRSRFLVESRYVQTVSNRGERSVGSEDVGLEDVFRNRITSWAVSPDTPFKNYFPGRKALANLIVPYLEIPAAAGWFAFEHLIRASGGKYVYFGNSTDAVENRMVPYLPDYASLSAARSKASRSVAAQALKKLVEDWDQEYKFPLYSVLSKGVVFRARNEARKHREFCNQKISELSILRKRIKSNKKLVKTEPLRWLADLDLAIAQLRVASFHLGQYALAADYWTDKNNPESRRPGGKIFKIMLKVPGTTISDADLQALARSIMGGKSGLDEYMAALKELNNIVDTHKGTPWALAAEELKKMWSIKIIGYTPRFCPDAPKPDPGPKKH